MMQNGKTVGISEKAGKGSSRYKAIETCIFISGLSVFAQLYLFQPLLPEICQTFHTDPATASLTVSSSTMGMAFGLLVLAFMADRVSRTKLMSTSLIVSAFITIGSRWAPTLEILIGLNFLKGFVISGVSAVALAYLSEEVDARILAIAIGYYLSGNTFGGMSGRVVTTLISGEWNWHTAVWVTGIESLLFGLLFARLIPDSRFFKPQQISINVKLQHMRNFVCRWDLLKLYIVAGLMMGTFVSMYNYLGFRLSAPPFSLPHYVIAFIFLMYSFGIVGSMVAGKMAARFSGKALLRNFILMMTVGLLLLLSFQLSIAITGLILFTFSFFMVHTTASRLVSTSVSEGKSSATCLYWLFYYIGSSLIGSGSGVLLHQKGWSAFIILLIVFTLISISFFVRKTTAEGK